MNKKIKRLAARRRSTHNKSQNIPPLVEFLSKMEARDIAMHIHPQVVMSKEDGNTFYFLSIVNEEHNAIIVVPEKGTVGVKQGNKWSISQDWLNIKESI